MARAREVAASRRCALAAAAGTGVAAGLALTMGAFAPASTAAPKSSQPLTLEIWPGGGPQRTGLPHTLKAQVMRDSGGGVNGVTVRFEVMEGPGDDDVGTAGATPEMPDLTCVTEGGSAHHPATCTVSYVEGDNAGGSDAVLAWVDADGLDATVEADLAEGENEHAAGDDGRCAVGTKGEGASPEADGTDCVEKRWIARKPVAVDLGPETGWADVGAATTFDALVLDQFGDPFTVGASATTVAVKTLRGSVHDPSDRDSRSSGVGTCSIDETGGCSVSFTSARAGRDLFCAYLPGHEAACSESRDAPERVDGADVVERSWGAGAPGASSDGPAPDAAAGPGKKATMKARDDRRGGTRRPSSAHRSESQVMSSEAPSSRATRAPSSSIASVTSQTDVEDAVRKGGRRSSEKARPQTEDGVRTPRRASSPPRSAPSTGDRPGIASPVPQTSRSAPRAEGSPVARRLAELSTAAAQTAERYSFPLVLGLAVFGFVAVQGHVDRRDPKLRLAPLDSKHDVVGFS